MHQLDQQDFVTRLDPKEMYRLTCEFPSQVKRAYEIASQVDLPKLPFEPTLVLVTGLGGSASGGDFTKALFEEYASMPLMVNRDYTLPKFVGKNTLVFATSYSGNTEETLSAYEHAQKAGCSIIAVTSGGKLAELAAADGFPVIKIPGGQPPRTALGFMLIPVIVACTKLGLIPDQDIPALATHLESCVSNYAVEVPFEQNPTKKLATALQGKVSTIYGVGSWQGIVAYRWRCQINENSKNLTFNHVFPELNHNEILGWIKANEQGVKQWVSILLEDGTESAKLKKRVEVTSNLIKGVTEIQTVTAPGSRLIDKMLGLACFGDFVSIYLAALNGVDPENIDSINILKNELSKVN
ncbi:MAG: bifunctional phosphoglucose/phosphomannose isomerase [Armatimonadetes bacterium]|nr:bifunctional phosphoglucose/phosphomannose isomerase [Armatimonadota bacterium]